MFKNRYTQNFVNIVAMFICICIIFSGVTIIGKLQTIKENIRSNNETEWRQQAKRTLQSVTSQLDSDLTNKLVDANDNISLQSWAKRNISSLRNGGPTGDAFMIRMYYENGQLVGKFIWDGSPDCAKPSFITNGRYLSDEPKMHYDQIQAQFICGQMLLGQSTLNTNNNYFWNFDGNPEYLEWDVRPIGALGFYEEPPTIGGVNNEKYNKILICLGTQQDEVESTFTPTIKDIDETIFYTEIFIILSIIACIYNMILYVYLIKRKQ